MTELLFLTPRSRSSAYLLSNGPSAVRLHCVDTHKKITMFIDQNVYISSVVSAFHAQHKLYAGFPCPVHSRVSWMELETQINTSVVLSK